MLYVVRIPDYPEMLLHALVLSLSITAIHVSFFSGNIFGWIREGMANWFDWSFGDKWSRYFQKPIWDCLPCMASIWTIILMWEFDLTMILIVCGINTIIEKVLGYD